MARPRAWAWGCSLHGTPLQRESILPAKREYAAVQPSSILRACITQHLTSLPPNPNLPTARPDLPLSTAQSTSSSSSPSFARHFFGRTWPGFFLFGSCKLSSSRDRLGRIGGREFSTAPSLWGWRYPYSLLRCVSLVRLTSECCFGHLFVSHNPSDVGLLCPVPLWVNLG